VSHVGDRPLKPGPAARPRPEQGTRSPTWVRLGCVALAAPQLFTGAWAIAAPAGWFAHFPGLGPNLVAADGPYNAHLAGDAGAGFLATAVALLVAAAWADRRVTVTALVTYLAFALPHFAYHLLHPADRLSGATNAGNVASLGLGAALPLVLLWGALKREPRSVPEVASG